MIAVAFLLLAIGYDHSVTLTPYPTWDACIAAMYALPGSTSYSECQ